MHLYAFVVVVFFLLSTNRLLTSLLDDLHLRVSPTIDKSKLKGYDRVSLIQFCRSVRYLGTRSLEVTLPNPREVL